MRPKLTSRRRITPGRGWGIGRGIARGIRAGAMLAVAAGTLAAAQPARAGIVTLANFGPSLPGHPTGVPIAGSDGAFYGSVFNLPTLVQSLSFPGLYRAAPPAKGQTAWQIAPVAVSTTESFAGALDPLAAGPGGVIYGAAYLGGCRPSGLGPLPCNALVALTPPAPGASSWGVQVLYRFDASVSGIAALAVHKGAVFAALVQANGCASTAVSACGSVARLAPGPAGSTPWTGRTIYRFTGAADGQSPAGPMLIDGQGDVFLTSLFVSGGTASPCAGSFCGRIVELMPPADPAQGWAALTVFTPGSAPDQQIPRLGYGLASSAGGAFWGAVITTAPATLSCQAHACGTVMRLSAGPAALPRAWAGQVIGQFTGGAGSGAWPQAGLAVDHAGRIWGTAAQGGAGTCPLLALAAGIPPGPGCGVLFSLTPSASAGGGYHLAPIYRFTGQADGGAPFGGVVLASGGLAVLGSTFQGGTGSGTLYEHRLPK